MARGLEKAIYTLRAMSSAREGVVCVADPRRSVLVCLVYLVVMLSVPVRSLQTLLFFAIYPIVASAMAGIGYWTVFSRSLIVLPFVLLIGIFNPLYHTDTGIAFGSVSVSEGWLEFVSILLRAMLSVQAVLILIADCGFTGICRSLGRLGTPAFLTTQLLMVYRYLCVLLQEAQNMRRARDARGYGRRDMSLKMWGEFTGQLFIRAVDRSRGALTGRCPPSPRPTHGGLPPTRHGLPDGRRRSSYSVSSTSPPCSTLPNPQFHTL